MSYEERLKIPFVGDENTCFFTKSGSPIAKGYDRIVIGERGPYVEFSFHHLIHDNIFLTKKKHYYYLEYRSHDESNVKIYYQLHTVDYADYIINSFYVSPFDLIVEGSPAIGDKINKDQTLLTDYLPS